MAKADPLVMKSGKMPIYIFNGPANLEVLKGLKLSGAHLHFNGPFNLQALEKVNLQNTTLVINDHQTDPPRPNRGQRVVEKTTPRPAQRPVLPLRLRAPDTSTTTPYRGINPNKRRRTFESSEDGEIRSSPSASTDPANLSAADFHPDRLNMLKRTKLSPCESHPPAPLPNSGTKANCLEMPFNRLEQQATAGGMSYEGTSRDWRRPGHRGRSVSQMSTSTDSSDEDLITIAEDINQRVDNFLRALEPIIPHVPPQSEEYGRLNPCSDVEGNLSKSPTAIIPSKKETIK